MPTPTQFKAFKKHYLKATTSTAQETNVARGNNHKVSSGNRKIDVDQNGESSKRQRKGTQICSTPGCGKVVRCRGHCKEHDPKGSYSTCKHTGCKNYTYKGEYCEKHHPNTLRCAKVGCNSVAQGGKYCYKHDPTRQKCKASDCKNKVNARFLCKKHDPTYHKCKKDNCKNQAQARGYCRKHDPNIGVCKEADCSAIQYSRRGRCKKHDDMYGGKKKG